METNTDTRNRRQRVDTAEAQLDTCVLNAAAAEKRKMRAMQEMVDADERLTSCVEAIEKARVDLAEALKYRDPAPTAAAAVDQVPADQAEDR